MPDIITLEAVYDASDIRTDYFDSDHGIEEWYVCDLTGKFVTLAKLLRALGRLPDWLVNLKWTPRTGEKYSMSDHPYMQLRCDSGTGLHYIDGGDTKAVRFIITACTRSIFEMNDRVDNPIPPTFEAMKAFIDSKVRDRQEQAQKYKEARERAKIVPADKSSVELRAIFDGLNDSEKVGVAFGMFPARLQALTRNDVVGLMKLREEVGPRMTFDDYRT